ncbi:MAG: hypothetical protein V1754_00175 [Pseudomonadota bacterium]
MIRSFVFVVVFVFFACSGNSENFSDGGIGVVDGFTEGGPPFVSFTNPDQPGPYNVGYQGQSLDTATWGEFPLTVYYPAKIAGKDTDADVSAAPYPLVVFAHGASSNKDANTWVCKHLVSWGFVCAMFSTPDPVAGENDQWIYGILGSIDLLSNQKAPPRGLRNMVSEEQIAAAGHSKGANAALLAAGQDHRIRAVVALAPCAGGDLQAGKRIDGAVQLQTAALDGICPSRDCRPYYGILEKPKQFLEIAGANHIGFIDQGLYYEAAKMLVEKGSLNDKPATITRDEQERISRKYMAAWLTFHLKGNSEAEDYVYGEPAQTDFSSGVLSAFDFGK